MPISYQMPHCDVHLVKLSPDCILLTMEICSWFDLDSGLNFGLGFGLDFKLDFGFRPKSRL